MQSLMDLVPLEDLTVYRLSRPVGSNAQVVSASDPHVHSESRPFFVGYPATLVSFRASGATLEGLKQDEVTVRRPLTIPLAVGV